MKRRTQFCGRWKGAASRRKFPIGYLWPVADFEAKIQGKAKRDEIQTLTISGVKHVGIIRKSSFGKTDNCIELYDIASVEMQVVGNLHRSEDATNQEETQRIQKFGFQQVGVTCTETEDGNVKLKAGSSKRKKHDLDDLDAFLGWPFR